MLKNPDQKWVLPCSLLLLKMNVSECSIQTLSFEIHLKLIFTKFQAFENNMSTFPCDIFENLSTRSVLLPFWGKRNILSAYVKSNHQNGGRLVFIVGFVIKIAILSTRLSSNSNLGLKTSGRTKQTFSPL